MSPSLTNAQTDPAVDIFRLFGPRTVHLQTVGALFTGDEEAAATGSGLLVADDLVLTDNHVVPEFGGQYQTTRLDVRVGSRSAQVRHGTVIARDPERDLALVQITPTALPRPYCPISALDSDMLTPQGTKIYVLSYPLDEDASVIDGLVRNKSSNKKWMTNAALTSNDSGGPAFTAQGYLIGLVVGGITEWTNLDGVRTPVLSVNYLIPIANLSNAGIDAEIAKHAGTDCWRMLTSILGPSPVKLPSSSDILSERIDLKYSSMVSVSANLPVVEVSETTAPTLPETFSRSYSVEETKSDHPAWPPKPSRKQYPPRTFDAEPGFRITNCKFTPISVNKASNIDCAVAADGRSASFKFDLESGPAFDRWRGWIHGAIVLQQRREK